MTLVIEQKELKGVEITSPHYRLRDSSDTPSHNPKSSRTENKTWATASPKTARPLQKGEGSKQWRVSSNVDETQSSLLVLKRTQNTVHPQKGCRCLSCVHVRAGEWGVHYKIKIFCGCFVVGTKICMHIHSNIHTWAVLSKMRQPVRSVNYQATPKNEEGGIN